MAARSWEKKNRGGARQCGVASSCGANRGEEWAQEVLGRLGDMPNGGAGQPVGG
jgi:hypothetical protein